MRARAGHGLFKETNDSLGMLARSNLGHNATKAGVEVNLSCNNICADHTMRIHDAHSSLVAGRLQTKDQIPCFLERCKRLFRAFTCNNRPRTHRCVRFRVSGLKASANRQRQLRCHQKRRTIRAVISQATANLGKSQLAIGTLSWSVILLHLKGNCGCTQHLSIVRHAFYQLGCDSLAATLKRNHHFFHLKLSSCQATTRKTDNRSAVVSQPPTTTNTRELVIERLL